MRFSFRATCEECEEKADECSKVLGGNGCKLRVENKPAGCLVTRWKPNPRDGRFLTRGTCPLSLKHLQTALNTAGPLMSRCNSPESKYFLQLSLRVLNVPRCTLPGQQLVSFHACNLFLPELMMVRCAVDTFQLNRSLSAGST